MTLLCLFSLVNIFFIPEWANLFGEQSEQQIFLTPTPRLNAYFALGSTVFILSLLLSIFLIQIRRYQFKKIETIFYLFIGASLIVPINFLREFTAIFNYYPQLSYAAHGLLKHFVFPYKVIILIVVAIAFIKVVRSQTTSLIKYVNALALLLAPIIVVTYANLFSKLYSAAHLVSLQNVISPSQIKNWDGPKVRWLIFDEMDYRLVFDDRPKGIKLPELDRLQKEAIFSSAAYPPNDYTIEAVPSLLSGARKSVITIKSEDLVLRNLITHTDEKWADISNIFRDVKDLGSTNALVGWYHNYCPVFKTDLDYCRRLPAGRFGYDESFFGSVLVILERAFILDKRLERAFIFNLEVITRRSLDRTISNNYGLSFFHFSVPHSPWIFDQIKGKTSPYILRSPEQYFGNMLLVDKIIGEFRRTLEANGEWNKSTLIISSDHSWRKSAEYDSKRDFRVPFIIKMADGKARVINKPIGTIVTKNFILEVMKKKISTTDEAVSWLQEQSKDFPKGTILIPFKDEETATSPSKKLDSKKAKG